jgi:hypothetical protein
MSLEELYRANNGSLYAIERFSKNRMFFTYRLLSEQEIRGFIDPTYSNKRESKAGSIEGESMSQPQETTMTQG